MGESHRTAALRRPPADTDGGASRLPPSSIAILLLATVLFAFTAISARTAYAETADADSSSSADNATTASGRTFLPVTVTSPDKNGRLLDDGTYTITSSVDSNLAVAVAVASHDDYAGFVLESYTNVRNERFYLTYKGDGCYTLRSMESGRYLSVRTSATSQMIKVDQYAETGGDEQLWRIESREGGTYAIISKACGLCLNIADSAPQASDNVNVWTESSAGNQLFKFERAQDIENGTYTISPGDKPSLSIRIDGASTSDGAKLKLVENADENDRKFTITYLGDWYYSMVCVNSNKALGVVVSEKSLGADIAQSDYAGLANQKWLFKSNGDGTYTVTSAGSNRCFDIPGSGLTSGADVIATAPDGSSDQRFTLSATVPKIEKTITSTATSTSLPLQGDDTVTYNQYGYSLDTAIKAQMIASSGYQGYGYSEFKTYMDPIGIMNPDGSSPMTEASRYAFLRIDGGYSGMTADEIDAFIDSTSSGRSGTLHGMGSAIVEAAKRYNINEAYLCSHAILESGWGTSALASGIPSGDSTYYNFFGIGAVDSAAYAGGSAMAVKYGWDSPSKAIGGAAWWISSNYTYNQYGQNTTYKMRYNPDLSATWKQYATGVSFSNSIAILMGRCYSYCGSDPALVFEVPVYSS